MKQRAPVIHLEALPQGVLLYTKPQMAAALQVSVRCITRLMRSGVLPYLRLGRSVRFRLEDVQRQLNERCLRREDSIHP